MLKKSDSITEIPVTDDSQYTSTTGNSPPPCSSCASECCTTATWDYAPTPLSSAEARLLSEHIDTSNKLIVYDGLNAIQIKENGYCVFVDEERMVCTIYPLRPFDCRIFPIDWYLDQEGAAWWVLWDCPLASQMDEATIEAQLCALEESDADYLREMSSYGNSQVSEQLEAQTDLRILRRIRLDLSGN